MYVDNLPDISFIDDTTVDEVLNQMMNDFVSEGERLTGKAVNLAPSNPYRLILYACAMAIYQGMQYTDFSGKMNLLKYSYGDFLDNIVAWKGVTRKIATPANTVLEFSIPAPLTTVVAIPKGTRVTNKSDVFFQTDDYTEIPIGETSVSIGATCTEAGNIGDIPIGTLDTLVNVLPYAVTVRNIVAAFGGADREDDESLRDRGFGAPKTYSVAGPRGAYEYQTKEVSQDIGDVLINEPEDEPGVVEVYFIMDDGTIPEQPIRDKVEEYLRQGDVRPLTDNVRVKAPITDTFNVDFTYYISESDKSSVTSIQSNVEQAVGAYVEWQTARIGRDINPDYLTRKLIEAGVKRVEITEPSYKVVDYNTIAKKGTVNITYGGVEDD